MIIIKRIKLLILILLASFIFCLPLFSDVLSDETLRSDLNYYRNVSKQKNLNANDRTYILNQIEEKYDGSGIDTTPLKQELEKTSDILVTQKNAGTSKISSSKINTQRVKAKGAKGKVEKIFVSETKDNSKIFIVAEGVLRSNYFLMEDPSSGKPPKIVLDLYGVRSKLSAAASNISPKNGLFSNVSTGQFEGPPNNVARVTAALRRDAPYTVKKEKNLWVISVDKTGQAQKPEKEVQVSIPATMAAEPLISSSSATIPAVPYTDLKSSSIPPMAIENLPEKYSKKVNDDYRIESADILGVTVYPSDELSREVVVQPDGNISFPLIGSAQAQGLTIKQLENSLMQQLGRYISAPEVSITVKQFSRRQIFITGEVKGVGAYNYKENLRLMEFISSIGGFTDSANRKEVKIYRGPATKRQTHIVDVEEIVKSGDFSKDFLLESGDIIEVLKGQAKISVLGDIRSPGYYDYKENMHLIELVSIAGGFSDTAKLNQVCIIRKISENKQTVVKVNFNKILSGKQKDVLIQSGDTVFFPKGNFASANFFLNNILPWLTLITLVIAIRGGI